jgi:rhodanese-related sulfurtransferase
MMDIAIHNLRPQAVWTIHGEHEYKNLVWLDQNQTKPTEEELSVEVARLQAEYNEKEYQRQRAAEYPSFADQFDLLYHGGYDAWKAAIDAVKVKYPKV